MMAKDNKSCLLNIKNIGWLLWWKSHERFDIGAVVWVGFAIGHVNLEGRCFRVVI